jgi:hypothetical protein
MRRAITLVILFRLRYWAATTLPTDGNSCYHISNLHHLHALDKLIEHTLEAA